jgi:hypothetical protein
MFLILLILDYQRRDYGNPKCTSWLWKHNETDFSLDFSSCFFFFSFLVLWSNGKMWQFPRKGGKNIDGS